MRRSLHLPLALAVVAACSGPQPTAPIGPSPTPPVDAAVAVVPAGPVPPVAARKPHQVVSPHGTRDDPYYWLRDDTRESPEVRAYLAAENAYREAVLAPTRDLEATLFAEMRARVKEDDTSVPDWDHGYWYYERYETGKQYPIYARKRGTLDAAEEVLLDGNVLAAGHEFFEIGGVDVSRDDKLLVWTDDTVGRRQYVLHVKDLKTGAMLADTEPNLDGSVLIAPDNKTLFLVGKDATTLREDRVLRHPIGGTTSVVFEETDEEFSVSIGETKSEQYIIIASSATASTETLLIDAKRPTSKPVVFIPRAEDHEYSLEHLGKRFVMLTNRDAENFRIVEIAPGAQKDPTRWRDVVAASDDMFVEDFDVYDTFLAATVRTGGLQKVRIVPTKGAPYFIEAKDPTYSMSVHPQSDPKTKRARFDYDSLVTPSSTYEQDLASGTRTLLKTAPVPGYDETQYTSEYLHAAAPDGAQVPISVVYKKTTPRDGTAPVLMMAYGAYGSSSDPYFYAPNLSLLDRGWVIATAHVRGGQELGRAWYEAGKLLNKRNTFTDFIAASEYVVAQKLAARDQVFAIGGSAGGLLMGAITNLRPDLYRGIVSEVPFVDVVTTMLDTSIPLTTIEFEEWGNPADKVFYDYLLGYSPYDNLAAGAYPSMYVTTGFWDSQVQYFEPAKYVAKLRTLKTDDNLLVMEVNMNAGHGGASGRFDLLHATARQCAFLLHVSERPDARRPTASPR